MSASASEAFKAKIAEMNRAELEDLRGVLTVRAEARRMKYSRTRSIKDGVNYRRTADELGRVRTQLTLLRPTA